MGDGILYATLMLAVVGLIFKFVPAPVRRTKCSLHAGIETQLGSGERRMDQMGKDIRATRKTVMAIAAHLQVPIGAIEDEIKEMM